jgi:hypothetical protein
MSAAFSSPLNAAATDEFIVSMDDSAQREIIIQKDMFASAVRTDAYADEVYASLPADHPIRKTPHFKTPPRSDTFVVHHEVEVRGQKTIGC